MYCLFHSQVKCTDNFSYIFPTPNFIKVLQWFVRLLHAYRQLDKLMDKAMFIGT